MGGEGVVLAALANGDPCQGVAKAVFKSILKRPRGQAGIFKAPKDSGDTRVHFASKVNVHEYSRCVGGSSCVPQDGTTLALGLGDLVRVVSEPESPKRKKIRNCGDGLSFLPVAQRERMLKASEPPGRRLSRSVYLAHRQELKCVQQSRAASLENVTNWQPMSTSLEKAQVRAEALAARLQKKSKGARAMKKVTATASGCRTRKTARQAHAASGHVAKTTGAKRKRSRVRAKAKS